MILQVLYCSTATMHMLYTSTHEGAHTVIVHMQLPTEKRGGICHVVVSCYWYIILCCTFYSVCAVFPVWLVTFMYAAYNVYYIATVSHKNKQTNKQTNKQQFLY